jgi:Protein of unknown function (DUF3137)
VSSRLPGSAGAFKYTRGAVIGNAVLVFAIALSGSVIVAAILVFVAARGLGSLERARGQAIAALCSERGLIPGVGSDSLAILGRIDPRLLSNTFSSPDQGLVIADFVRPAGKNTQFFTLLSFAVPGLNVPDMAVTVRNLPGPVLGGPPTVELESEEFDKRFVVKANDRRSAVMVLDPAMMQLVLDCGQVSFDLAGDRVLASINRANEPRHRATAPVEFALLFKFRDGFVARLPSLLRSDYGAPA